jgi:hypothetical protein
MKIWIPSASRDEEAATYEICGQYLGNDTREQIVEAEAPWKRM